LISIDLDNALLLHVAAFQRQETRGVNLAVVINKNETVAVVHTARGAANRVAACPGAGHHRAKHPGRRCVFARGLGGAVNLAVDQASAEQQHKIDKASWEHPETQVLGVKKPFEKTFEEKK
jgi:hypothetical protein